MTQAHETSQAPKYRPRARGPAPQQSGQEFGDIRRRILQLQQAAGNEAVTSLLSRETAGQTVVQRQHVRTRSGTGVGNVTGPDDNRREDVMAVQNQLHVLWSMSNDSYAIEYPPVAQKGPGEHIDPASLPATIAAIAENEKPILAPPVAANYLQVNLSSAIGAGNPNVRDEVLRLQDALHVHWHLTNEQYAAARNEVASAPDGPTVQDSDIPTTLKGVIRMKAAMAAATTKRAHSPQGGGSPAGGVVEQYTLTPEERAQLAGWKARIKEIKHDLRVLEAKLKVPEQKIKQLRHEIAEKKKLIDALRRKKSLTGAEKAKLEKLEPDVAALEAEEQRLEAGIADDEALKEELATEETAVDKSDTETTLADIGQTIGGWFGEIQNVKFLGRGVGGGVHRLLAEKLQAVETKLSGIPPPEGGWLSEDPSGRRGPGSGMHGFGLAIDLNFTGNPFILFPIGDQAKSEKTTVAAIGRASLLVDGISPEELGFTKEAGGKDKDRVASAMETYDMLRKSSSAVTTYLGLQDPSQRSELEAKVQILATSGKDPRNRGVDEWLRQIAEDRNILAAGFERSDPAKGFIDLDRRLVEAMVAQGLTWLGANTIGGGRDIMHFDTRELGPIKRIFSSAHGSSGGWINLTRG